MGNDSSVVAIAGIGVCIAFLGFLAYLIMINKQEQPSYPEPQPGITPAAQEVCIPQSCPPVVTEEKRPTRPHIINHRLNEASRWYEIPIPPNVKAWTLKPRGTHELNYSFETSHSTFMTLEKNQVLTQDTLPATVTPWSIYVMSEDSDLVVELEIWR